MGTTADRLSAGDVASLLVEDGDTPMTIAVLVVVDGDELLDRTGGLDLAAVRGRIERNLVRVPRLRQRPYWPVVGGPVWVDDAAFEIARHVGHVTLTGADGTDRLLRLTERLIRLPFDRSRPLWRIRLVTGLPDRRVAVVVTLHHALADGVAAVRLVGTLLDTSAGPPRTAWIPRPPPSAVEAAAGALRDAATSFAGLPDRMRAGLRSGWHDLLRTAGTPATSLTRPVGPRRRIDVVRLPLAEVRAVAHRYGGTVNDVVLDLVAGATRTLLAARGEPVDRTVLRVAMAVSHRAADDAERAGNRVGVAVVLLPLAPADPAARLPAVVAETARAKRAGGSDPPSCLVALLARTGLLHPVTRRQRLTNLTESDVVGPAVPVRVLGAPVVDLVPVGLVAGNLALSFLAFSYAGRLTVSVCADADAFGDLPVLTEGLRRAWADLARPGGGARPTG